MPNKKGIGISTVDGRANLSHMKIKNNDDKFFEYESIMTFKAHKV